MAKKSLRLSSNKKIAGVAAGVAEYFDLDVTTVRLVWIVLTILTGILPGTLLYIVLWLLMQNKGL